MILAGIKLVKVCSNSLPVLNTSLFIRYFIASSLLIGVLIFLSSFTTSPAGLDEDILKYTNQFRRSKGLPTLVMRQDLNEIAKKHSEDMARGMWHMVQEMQKKWSRCGKILMAIVVICLVILNMQELAPRGIAGVHFTSHKSLSIDHF